MTCLAVMNVSVWLRPELLEIEMMNLVPSGLYLLRLRSGSCKGKKANPMIFSFHHSQQVSSLWMSLFA